MVIKKPNSNCYCGWFCLDNIDLFRYNICGSYLYYANIKKINKNRNNL